MLIVGMISYVSVSNKQSAQLAQLKKLEEELSNGSSIDDLYKSYEGGDIIPIYTPKQLELVGTGETAYTEETGKIYTYALDKTYMFYGKSEDITNVINKMVEQKVTEIIKNNNYATEIYPVGSIYISTTETNPSEYFGGTWEAYGQGRTIIGAGTGTDANGTSQTFVADGTGGEYKHTLTVAETPAHTHTRGTMDITGSFLGILSHSSFEYGGAFSKVSNVLSVTAGYDGSGGNWASKIARTEFKASNSWTGATSSVGGSGAHNNIQPYITCYIWKRTQ